jgi:uncharacterized integral membrane protein
MRFLVILALLLALLVTIFAVQNSVPILVTFLAWHVNGSLALVLMLTLALGVLIGILLMTPAAVRRRLQAGEMKRTIRALEVQLGELQQAAPPAEPAPAVASPAQQAGVPGEQVDA